MQMPPLNLEAIPSLRHPVWLPMLRGHRVLNGLAVGLGMDAVSVLAYLATGPLGAASASVGRLIQSTGDQISPARGKLSEIAPLLWTVAPMTAAVQVALRNAASEARALGADLATAPAWEAARLQEKQR